MQVQRHTVALAVDASGDQTTYTTDNITGRVLQIRYVPDASTPLDTGADLTITGETTGTAIITITNIGTSAIAYAPRLAICGITGTASLFAAGGTAVQDQIYIANERVKIVVAQGGASKLGTLYLTVG